MELSKRTLLPKLFLSLSLALASSLVQIDSKIAELSKNKNGTKNEQALI